MWLLIHAWIKVKPCWWNGPLNYTPGIEITRNYLSWHGSHSILEHAPNKLWLKLFYYSRPSTNTPLENGLVISSNNFYDRGIYLSTIWLLFTQISDGTIRTQSKMILCFIHPTKTETEYKSLFDIPYPALTGEVRALYVWNEYFFVTAPHCLRCNARNALPTQ